MPRCPEARYAPVVDSSPQISVELPQSVVDRTFEAEEVSTRLACLACFVWP